MRPQENYVPLTGAALGLTLAILITFQVYIFREPARIAADEARDKSVAVQEGKATFVNYCTQCHGQQGEGAKGPALNDKGFLAEVSNDRMFSLVSSGVPGTEMPAWNQEHGGPFTDQQVRQLVAYIRNWEPTAPDRRATPPVGDSARGAAIFASICFACHGVDGQGTERAPALNDPARLKQFDDAWYRDTITQGRPAKGMPTWGTVLSPKQIADLIALLGAWREGQLVAPQP